MDASGADWSYSLPLWAMPDGVLIPIPVDLNDSDELDHFLLVENRIPSTCVMHSRQALERVGYWPETVPRTADWQCWKRIIETSRARTVGCCAVPTALHFSTVASRRDALMNLRWKNVPADVWPASCRIIVPSGETEQRYFFDVLAPAPSAWVDRVRAAIPDVVERQARAWTAALESEVRTSDSRWRSRSALARRLATTFFRKGRVR
jgi:hypothetical protein